MNNILRTRAYFAIPASAVAALLLISGAAAQNAPPLKIEWTLAKTEKPLEREATIVVTEPNGSAVVGANIEVSVDMPSMPMMHHVPKAKAEPTAQPGRYKVRFTLEMPGEWAARIQVTQPRAGRVIKRFMVD